MVQLPLGALLPSGHSHWHHQGRLLLLPCGAGCGLPRLPESAGSPRQCRWPQPLVLPPELNQPQPPSAGAPAPSLPSCSPCCSWLENGHGSWTLIPGRHSAHLGGSGSWLAMLSVPGMEWGGGLVWRAGHSGGGSSSHSLGGAAGPPPFTCVCQWKVATPQMPGPVCSNGWLEPAWGACRVPGTCPSRPLGSSQRSWRCD